MPLSSYKIYFDIFSKLFSFQIFLKNYYKFKRTMMQEGHHFGKMLYCLNWGNEWDRIVSAIHHENGNACVSFPLLAIFINLQETKTVKKAKAIIELTNDNILSEISNLPANCKGMSFFTENLFSWTPKDDISGFRKYFFYKKDMDIISNANSERIRVLASSLYPLRSRDKLPDDNQIKYIIDLLKVLVPIQQHTHNFIGFKICVFLPSILETLPFAIKPQTFQDNNELPDEVFNFLMNVKQWIKRSYESGNNDGMHTDLIRIVCKNPDSTQDGILRLCLLFDNKPTHKSADLIRDIFLACYSFLYTKREKGGRLSIVNARNISEYVAQFIKKLCEIKNDIYGWTDFLNEHINYIIEKGLYDPFSDEGGELYVGLSYLRGILRRESEKYRRKPRVHICVEAILLNGRKVNGKILDISQTGCCFLWCNEIEETIEKNEIAVSSSEKQEVQIKHPDGGVYKYEVNGKYERYDKNEDNSPKNKYIGLSFGSSCPSLADIRHFKSCKNAFVS
jgi:hypothetical protein